VKLKIQVNATDITIISHQTIIHTTFQTMPNATHYIHLPK